MVLNHLPPLEAFQAMGQASEFLRLLNLSLDEFGPDHVRGSFDVDARHHQPFGIVHAGVYAAVVETVASVGAWLAVRDRGQTAVGINNSSDFLRPETEGRMTVEGRALHQGRTQQLWDVTITNAAGKTVALGRVRLQNVPAA